MNKITRDDTAHGVEYVRADEAQAEVLEQCRIIAMGAEREDALRAELTRLKASIALDKMAENARELGLDYEPAPVQGPVAECTNSDTWNCKYCRKTETCAALKDPRNFATPPVAPVQDLPFGVGGGLVAIKTLLGRDPCVHANTAIEMIDAILKEHPTAQPAPVQPIGEVIGRNEYAGFGQIKHAKTIEWFGEPAPVGTKLYTTQPAQPAPVQEPVAYDKTEMNCFVQELYDKKMCEGKHGHYETMFHCVHQAIKRVTPPAAQKQWVGLTDDEIKEILWNLPYELGQEDIRAIEAKLKGKNHG
jgi:hypothetical protein